MFEHFWFHILLKDIMGDPPNDSKWHWHQCGSNRKKNMLFFQPNFHFFFGKNTGSSTEKFRMRKWKKTRYEKKFVFCTRRHWGILDVQYCCRILIRYKNWCPESLGCPVTIHLLRPATLSKSATILSKNVKKSVLEHTSQHKMLLRMGPTIFFYRK